MNKKRAFTLAEVLITLGIIGVVAALTMPSLMANYKKSVAKNQFKKTYSTLTNAFNQTVQELGENIGCTEENYSGSDRPQACKELWNEFVKNLNVVKYCETDAYAQGCIPDYSSEIFPRTQGCGGFSATQIKEQQPAAVLADGSIIFPYGWQKELYPAIGFDINGFKKPNAGGLDVFSLGISSKSGIPVLGAWHNGYLSYCLPMTKETYFYYIKDIYK